MHNAYALVLLCLLTGATAAAQPGIDHTATSIPTDDGHQMAIDYYLAGDSSAKPTILVQTPYNRKLYRIGYLPLVGQDFANSDYHVVTMDWRGFYENSSVPVPQGFDRGLDGVDCIEWIRQQPWSDGTIVTYGGSALGKIQYQTARHEPQGLVAICPQVAYPGTHYDAYYHGGVKLTGYLKKLDALGYGLDAIVSANYVYDNVWQFVESDSYYMDEIKVPVLSTAGWYDHNVEGQTAYVDTLLTAGDPGIRDAHKYLVGPWTHGGVDATGPGTLQQGEIEHPNAVGFPETYALQFFDYYALGANNGWDTVSTYTYFNIGSERWATSPTWPPADVQDKPLYLHPADNRLRDTPVAVAQDVSFAVDPTDPTPTIGGQTLSDDLLQGPYDQREDVESRNDVAVLTSVAFTDTLNIRGAITLRLFMQVNRPDADVAVRLTDVYPDGRSILLAEDMQRLRYLNGRRAADTALISPGEVYEVTITLPPLSLDLAPDHRLRLILAGNNAPWYDVNLQNGGALYSAGDSLVATHTYVASASRPSQMVLPVLNPEVASGRTESAAPSLGVWPNPSHGALTVQVPSAVLGESLRIVNVTGQTVYQRQMTRAVTHLTLDLPAGVYVVQYDGWSRRVVVE